MQSFNCTDTGNAKRFQEYHKDTVRYIPELKQWVYWTSRGWRYAKIFKLSEPVVQHIYKEAAQCAEDKDRVELGQWGLRSESKAFQRSMVEFASHFMDTPLDEFDSNPRVINCKNGVVNLETKELLPHAPAQLHLKAANASYFPQATCPRWMRFLDEVFGGDAELIRYIQIGAGYSILGLTAEHLFFICDGRGRNGKGVLLDTIEHVLGNYSVRCDFATFLQTDRTNVRLLEAVGNLKGKRFAVASETNDSTRLNEALVKRLTGGDRLTGTQLNKGSFEFDPTHTIWFACNHLPAIKDATVAMWERVRTIPFERTFLGDEDEKGLKQTLRSEADGIFAWLVDGASQYLKDGRLPKIPSVCKDATEDYRDSNDKLSIFIKECLVKDNGGTIGIRETYDKYYEWCPSANESPIEFKFFSSNMDERGVKRKEKRTSSGEKFQGWRFKTEEEGGSVVSVVRTIVSF